jgi:muramidase (phage lysozyme)
MQRLHPNIIAFLALIRKSEGGRYNILFGGKKFTDFSKHPNICVPYRNTCSTASGAYQILKKTYEDFKGKAGVNDFTPDSQDRIAVELIKRRNAYNDIINGNIATAIQKCGNEWASFGFNNYNQPTHSLAQLLEWYQDFLKGTTKKKNIEIVIILLIVAGFLYYKTIQ